MRVCGWVRVGLGLGFRVRAKVRVAWVRVAWVRVAWVRVGFWA